VSDGRGSGLASYLGRSSGFIFSIASYPVLRTGYEAYMYAVSAASKQCISKLFYFVIFALF